MTKVAAITGGASGIGQGTSRRLLGEGWTVVALDRDQAGLDALRKEFASHGDRLQTQVCDVTSVESVTGAFAEIGRRFFVPSPTGRKHLPPLRQAFFASFRIRFCSRKSAFRF